MFKFYRFTLYLLTFIFEASILNAFEALPLEDANISTVRLSLNLLGEEKVFAQKTSSADLGNGSFSWTGKVDDTPSSFLSFVCMSGYYNGSISMSDGRIFTFLGQNGELLFKPARKDFKSCGGCQVKGSLPPDPRHAAQSQRTWQDGDANLIDLLVVYPTVVKTAAGGTTALQALIASAIADTNLCYQNSLVQMQVRLVHSAEVNYTPTGTLAIELQRLEGKSDGYMDEIHTLRNTYGADLVAMLTTVSDSGGLANTMSHPSLAFESSGFNVNIWDQLGAPSYTLAHEIGHNMGCLHNREDSDGDRSGYNFGSFSFGKRWIENGQGYATVMSYDTTPTSTYPNTIPYFSNPDVTYLSTPTGNANSEDNAQVLASTAPYVSNFRRSSVQAILPTSFSYFVGEGNSTSFSVRLTVEPSSPLTVNLAISGDNDLFLSGPSSLQFDSTNWNLPHPVQISAKPDSDNSAGSGTLILSASGINSTSIQITEIDVGTSIDLNPIFSGVILNELGMGIPQVVLTFSNSGGTTQTDENGTFRIGLTSGWSGTITPSLTGYSFSPSVITSQALSTNSLGNLLQASRSSILYVDRDATGRRDGTSWANAYTDLSSALVSMNEFTEVWVAEGTYYPGNTKADSFILPPNTPVYGGFSGVESSRSERNSSAYITTLSGDIGTIGDGSDNSFHVVVPSQNSLLDGFVIRDGNASQNFTDYRGLGAGLFADRTEFIISNCSFIDNQSYQRGGGVCIIDSNATFQHSQFTGHFSTIGGVIDANNSILILESCQFTNNSSELEGGVLNSIGSEVNATNCTFNSNQNTQNNGAGVVNVEGGTFSDVNGSYSNNQSLSKGGAFYAEGATLSFSNANFQSNQSVYQGGAVRTLDSNLTLVDTTFNANTSTNNSGGAVYFENGTFSDVNGVYSQNISVYQGGALVLKNAQSQFSSSVFTGNQNSTTNGAGAVYLTDSNLSVLNCAFTSNSAAFQGGAIIWENSSGSITDSNFTENINTTSNGGGGISLKNSSPSILRCIFTGNVSQPSYGGALHLDNSSSTIEDSIFTLNKTDTFDGGAIYINSTSNPTITGNTFTSNVAGQSGGAIYNSTTNLTLSQCMFLRNSSNFGGAVSSSGSVISFSDIHFLGNEANSSSSSSGGAVYFGTGSTSSLFVNCIFSGNKSAGRHGVYRPKGATRFVNCALIGNEAGTDGGVTLMFSGDSIESDNSIIWNNSAGTGNDVWVNGGTASANYSLFNPSESIGTISGSNNLNSDPLFVDADGADNLYGSSDDNLSLQSTSPAIDQGSSSASNYSTLDINGRTRDANPDLGAFEYSSNTAPVFATTTTVSVSENQTAVIDINSTDSDNDVLSYSITGGSDQAKFQIDSGTGILTFINSPDFESPADSNGDGIYQVIITVSDSIDSISQEVSVSVIDGVDPIETFMVSGGQFSSPYYTITNAAGSVVNFSSYQFQKGGLYYFVASNISSSHPFMIGESYGDLTSSLVSGGPLTSSNNGSRITLNIPSGFNGQLLYFCTAHSSMQKNLLFSNASPVISSGSDALSLSLPEDTSLSYDFNGTDADGDSLTWMITTGASNGSASIVSGTGVFSYTPTANYNGSDSVVIQVSDGTLSDSLTVNLSISAVNNPPIITDLNATLTLNLPEDTSLSYDFNGTDVDGDSLSWTITTGASNGSASIDSGTGVLSYTPIAHYNGSDSLVVEVSDGLLIDSVTVNLSISAVIDAPVVTDLNATLALTLPEGSSLSYDFNGTDVDGDSLTWSITTGPSNGAASIDPGSGVLSYTPTANYNGSDSLIVQVSDGSLIDSVTINLSISSVNDAPVILDLNASLALSLLEDSTLSYDFNATDSDGDTMTWSITTGPTNGTASIDSGTGFLHYTPTANYSGMDSLAVQVSDGELSDNLTISLTVHSENDAPIIFGPSIAITISSAEDTNLTREMNASDPDGDSLVWRVETSPIHGMASVDSSTGFLNYVSNLNFVGLDSLTLEVSDGILFDRQVFNIVVTAVNDAPLISSVFEILDINTTEDNNISYDLNASDLDGDSLTWSVLSSPSNGSSSIDSSTGNLLYWPNPNYTGADSLTVKVSDGSLDDNITINLSISPINDEPVIIESSPSLSFTFFEDQNFTREMNASDVDGDSLTWSISSSPNHGSASVNSSTGYLSYIPNSNFVGLDSLKVELSDGFLTDQQIFNFVMIEKNDAPVFTDSNDTLAFTLSEDQQLSRMINASDAEGDDISWSIRQAPTNGTASIISSTGMLFYLPNLNYFGSDLLTVQVSDGSLSSEITIYLSVLPINDAPVINELNSTLSFTQFEDQNFSREINATDVDADSLTWSLSIPPAHGIASIGSTTGSLIYTPNDNYLGADGLSIRVTDGSLFDELVLQLNVIGVNDAPVITNPESPLTLSTTEDNSLSYDLNATDADGDNLTWSISSVPTNGSASINLTTGIMSYSPNVNFNGSDNLQVQVSDGALTDNIEITVITSSVNDAPVVTVPTSPFSLSVLLNDSIVYDFNASDSDGNTLSWNILSNPSSGSASIDSTLGILNYSPNLNYLGNDSMVVQVSDGSLTNSVTLNLTVIEFNNAPVISETNDFLTFSISEDSLLIYDLNATDAEGTTLVWGLSIAPANGIASIDSVSGLLEYTPNPNYSGTESLTVQVSDGLYVDNLQINLNVNAVNDVPVIDEIIKPLTLTVIEDTTIMYDLNATDLDGNTLTWTILSPTTIGTTLLDSRTGMLVYSPQGNFNGSTTLSVQVSDGLSSDSLTVVLNTVPVNDPPNNILLSNSSIAEGLSVGHNIGVFTAEDPDNNQSHTFSLVSGSADNESFSLDLNGSLQTAEIFDFEEKFSYSIRVQTKDQGGLSFERAFTITITDSTEISVDSVVLLSEGVSASAGWKQAGWFGYYFSQSYPWIYHPNLGWIYVSESETTGLWLYREPLGWLWTNPSTYPYLYKNESSNWLYLDREHGPIRYYDYSTSNWDIAE